MNPISEIFPEVFRQRIEKQFPSDWEKLLEALNEDAPISVRLNPALNSLSAASSLERVPWESNAFYLTQTCKFGTDPLFQGGGYYVQEASSMAIGWMMKQIIPHFNHKNLLALDACAAPGGKSTHILSTLSPEAVLVANEIVPARYTALVENLTKWGNLNQIILQKPLSALSSLQECFDIIVADAPCSGEGIFRKNPEARAEWNENSEQICATRQVEILENLLPLLKPGGILLYSTCTFAPAENEGIISFLHSKELYCICTETAPGSGWRKVEPIPKHFGWQALPHLVKGEGFFFTAYQKSGKAIPTDLQNYTFQKKSKSSKDSMPVPFQPPEGITFHEGFDGSLFILSEATLQMQQLLAREGIRSRAGLQAGVWKGNKFIPDQELAYWKWMPTTVYPHLEVNRENAVRYLRKENLDFTPEGNGFHLITYRGIGLGWINLIPGRQNNMYPPSWRFRDVSDPALDPFPEQK